MTDLSNRMKDEICRFCDNGKTGNCAANVPWYAASIRCNSFKELVVEKKVMRHTRAKIMRSLVETF